MTRRQRIAPPGPLGILGASLVIAIGALALLGPIVLPGNPLAAAGSALQPPGGGGYLFGTDDLGRDVLLGVVYGARASLLAGGIAAVTSALLGTAVGAAAGFYGPPLDDVLMRLTEAVLVAPRFFLAVLVAALFGPSLWYLALLLGLTFWPQTARLLRAQVLSLRQREYVLAARAVGLGPARILVRHVLPNAASVVVITAALQVGAAILVEASLSFLGLGDRTQISWGYMLNNAQPFLRTAWWMSVFPGLALALTVLGTNLLADGLQAALDPRLVRR
ncbi:MAG TPA: ABC transporter permease [Chloroflexota bacterium]|nr:ABC transporter permease [Chloroflexota bacterium]